jgi:hypothetical protein
VRTVPNLFLGCLVLEVVYRREFFIESKHEGEQLVSFHSGGVSEIICEQQIFVDYCGTQCLH